MDRLTLAGSSAFASKQGAEYLENNCAEEPNKLCEFKRISGKILKTVDSVYQDVASVDECRELCLSSPYRCHSYDYGDTGKINFPRKFQWKKECLVLLTKWHVVLLCFPFDRWNGLPSQSSLTCDSRRHTRPIFGCARSRHIRAVVMLQCNNRMSLRWYDRQDSHIETVRWKSLRKGRAQLVQCRRSECTWIWDSNGLSRHWMQRASEWTGKVFEWRCYSTSRYDCDIIWLGTRADMPIWLDQ